MLPDLNCRLEHGALRYAAKANRDRGGIVRCGAIEWRAAFGTKHLGASIAALRDLDVRLRLPSDHECCERGLYDGTERRAGKDLAIRAMAHHHPRRIDFGGKGNRSAVARAVDVHDGPRKERDDEAEVEGGRAVAPMFAKKKARVPPDLRAGRAVMRHTAFVQPFGARKGSRLRLRVLDLVKTEGGEQGDGPMVGCFDGREKGRAAIVRAKMAHHRCYRRAGNASAPHCYREDIGDMGGAVRYDGCLNETDRDARRNARDPVQPRFAAVRRSAALPFRVDVAKVFDGRRRSVVQKLVQTLVGQDIEHFVGVRNGEWFEQHIAGGERLHASCRVDLRSGVAHPRNGEDHREE